MPSDRGGRPVVRVALNYESGSIMCVSERIDDHICETEERESESGEGEGRRGEGGWERGRKGGRPREEGRKEREMEGDRK